MMVAVPGAIPLMIFADSVATAVLLLLHVPPEGELTKVVVSPVQMVALPLIAVGSGFTVTICVRLQPPAKE